MTETRSNPFSWLNFSPDTWQVTYAAYDQTCGICQLNMYDTKVTNVRGAWEHFECVRAAYEKHLQTVTTHVGTQRQCVEFIHSVGTSVTVVYDRTRPRDRRYRWWTS